MDEGAEYKTCDCEEPCDCEERRRKRRAWRNARRVDNPTTSAVVDSAGPSLRLVRLERS